MSFLLGGKVLKRLAQEQDAFAFYRAKLSPDLFKGDAEQALFAFTKAHYDEFQAIPTVDTLEAKFPDLKGVDVPEPAKYYVKKLESRFGYDTLQRATSDARDLLKSNADNIGGAEKVLRDQLNKLLLQRYRAKILDVGVELPELLLTTYHGTMIGDTLPAYFGWKYLDDMGGVHPTEVVSFVGRPATGKSWKMLYCALHNWRERQQNVLFVSMEMGVIPVGQRIGSMYTGTPASQLKVGGFSTQTFEFFVEGISGVQKEPAKFYVIDGNLAASVEEIYALAEILGCKRVFIDGAYLVRNPNPKLDRFTRVADNVELMKKYTTTGQLVTFASWQFNRDATKNKMKKGGVKESPKLEDIGYSDAIGQISAIVIGILQDEGVETLVSREMDLLKGRNGEIGKFKIAWDFFKMDFSQWGSKPEHDGFDHSVELDFI